MLKETLINNIILISGLTASGKTNFAIELAHFLKNQFNISSEIINADSMQLYNELKIITAHPSFEEQQQIKHNMYGILSPFESSSVTNWLNIAKTTIQRLNNKGKIAIICGGTGLYIDAIINGISFIPEIPQNIRHNIRQRFHEIGRDAFFEELLKIDKESSKRLHKNNTQRLIRAYEVVTFSGKPISEWWKESSSINPQYNILGFFVLIPEKEKIHEKIHQRIIKMFQNGAIEEIKEFLHKYKGHCFSNCPLSKAIGFKEICELLENKYNDPEIADCINKMYINTKKYAKRQSTWFRHRFKSAKFLHGFGDNHTILNEAYKSIQNKLN